MAFVKIQFALSQHSGFRRRDTHLRQDQCGEKLRINSEKKPARLRAFA